MREEEEHERLGEVGLDGGHGERHAGEVGEGIANEHVRGEGVEIGQSEDATEEGKHEVHAVHVLRGARAAQLHKVVRQHRQGDHHSLARLQS